MELFSIKDPRGFIITCTKECWNNHLDKHPEINGLENQAKKAIEEPLLGIIYRSNHSIDRDIYYQRVPGRPVEIKVVVQFDSSHAGSVKSIYVVLNRQKGEMPVWPL
jgi:hypothetical protein